MGLTNLQRGRQVFLGGAEMASRAYVANGPIAANLSHTGFLTKAGVGAYTLAAPARDGIRLRLVNRTANAHVLTATSLIDNGITGASKTTVTFAAFPGSSIEFESFGGKWNVIGQNVITSIA